MRIHELKIAIDQIEELVEQGEYTKEQVADTLLSLEGDFEDKIDSILLGVKNLELESEGFKAESKRLKDLADQSERQAARLKEYVDYACQLMDKKKFSTSHFKVSYRKGSEVVEIENEDLIPEETPWHRFKEPQPPKLISKTELKKLIKEGVEIPGVRLVRNPDSLQVK